MTPGTIFLSHRAEYRELAKAVKEFIQRNSTGRIRVFISEDIPKGEAWRSDIESKLQDAESLFLIYGSPHEDWSWCFYETGYFAALCSAEPKRKIYCLAREDIAPPAPLEHLQLIMSEDEFVDTVLAIYEKNKVDNNAADVRIKAKEVARPLFGKLAEFVGCPRVYFEAVASKLDHNISFPAESYFKAEKDVMKDIFGIRSDKLFWNDLSGHIEKHVPDTQRIFAKRWIDETAASILASRNMQFSTPQAILIGPKGKRFRFFLSSARLDGDGRYRCEFIVLDEIGGPAVGMSNMLLSLLTSIRMAFRFRYEVIQLFPKRRDVLSEYRRSMLISSIPRLILALEAESAYRGDVNLPDFYEAFDQFEAERMRTLIEDYWPVIRKSLFDSLGVSEHGDLVSEDGLKAGNLEKFHITAESLRDLNLEFLSRCCECITQMVAQSNDEAKETAKKLEEKVAILAASDMISTAA